MGKIDMTKLFPSNLLPQLRLTARVAQADYEAIRVNIFKQVRYLGLAWCNPMTIENSTRYFVKKQGGFLVSAKDLPKKRIAKSDGVFIAAGDWDTHITPLNDVKHIKRATQRFETGESWVDVGEVEWMMQNITQYGIQDNCKNLDEVLARCSRFDSILNDAMKYRRILTRKEVTKKNFRERHGIGVVIGREGDIIWFSDGAHRLAISRHLKLKEIPVCIHLIHSEAIHNNKFMKNIYTEPKLR